MTLVLKSLRILAIVAAIVAAAIYAFARIMFGSGGAMAERPPGMRGGLSSVRSAIQVYYGDNQGRFPTDDLSCLVKDGKYLSGLPELWNDDGAGYRHPPARGVQTYRAGEPLRDTGKWAYFNDPEDRAGWGNFAIDCTHALIIEGGLFGRQRYGEVWSTF